MKLGGVQLDGIEALGEREVSPAFAVFVDEYLGMTLLIDLANYLIRCLPEVQEAHKQKSWTAQLGLELSVLLSRTDTQPDLFERLGQEVRATRLVDSFNVYVAEMLHDLFRGRPETLRSSKQVPLEEVLRHGSLDEFIASVAREEVDQLSFVGLDKLLESLRKRKIDVRCDEADLQSAREAIGVRNILVHNRGVVNERFVRDTKMQCLRVGDCISADESSLAQWGQGLMRVAFTIDQGLIEKFGLPLFESQGQTPRLRWIKIGDPIE